MKFLSLMISTWKYDKQHLCMARHTYDVLTAVALQKPLLLPSYATPPFLTILSNVLPQDRDGPMETTTWWALVAQRDLQ